MSGIFRLQTSSKHHEDIFSHDFSLIDLGLRQPRLEGEEYISIVDEFMEAVFTRWPKAIVQVYLCVFIYIYIYFFEKNVLSFCYREIDKT